jgi:hypothetical protein
LNADTDETLLKIFDRDPGDDTKTASSNHVTMPSRNWAMITESSSALVPHSDTATNGTLLSPNDPSIAQQHQNETHSGSDSPIDESECTGKDGHSPLHAGEENAGSTNRAVTDHGKKGDGSLDVSIRVEKDQHDSSGATRAYGFWIPPLKYDGAAEKHVRRREAILHGHRGIHTRDGPGAGGPRSTYTSHSGVTEQSGAERRSL